MVTTFPRPRTLLGRPQSPMAELLEALHMRAYARLHLHPETSRDVRACDDANQLASGKRDPGNLEAGG